MGIRNTNVATVVNNQLDNQRTNIHELRRIKAAVEALLAATISGGAGDASLAEQQTQTAELVTINNTLSSILGSANTPDHLELTNPVAEIVSSFKELSFVCSGTITVTINGNDIIYPYTLGAATILGSTFRADTVSGSDVTFDGTGTVLLTLSK